MYHDMADISSEDRERIKLLTLISSSKHEFDKLSLEQLARLQELLEKKDYSHDKKADKSKSKSGNSAPTVEFSRLLLGILT